MPELVLYKGRPVKRRARTSETRLDLFFVSPTPGQRSERINISQAEWNLYGTTQFFPKETMPDVRELARNWRSTAVS